MRAFVRQLSPAILGIVVFTVLCGLVYPLWERPERTRVTPAPG